MTGQHIGGFGIKFDFLCGPDVDFREIVFVYILVFHHLTFLKEAATGEDVLILQFFLGAKYKPSRVQGFVLLGYGLCFRLILNSELLLL